MKKEGTDRRVTPYANNKDGYIKAPRNTTAGNPKPTADKGNDLRVKK